MDFKAQINQEPVRLNDKKSFEELFRTYYQALCRYAYPVLKDLDEAEEVVQNVFYNLWNKRESLEINTSIKSYLYRAVHNDCLNKLKHLKVRREYAEDYTHRMDGDSVDGGQTLQAKELNKRIQDAIATLPEQCRAVFKLSRFEELKYQEIADQLNISIKTVENHMGKALKILREKLKDYLPAIIWLITYYNELRP